MIIEELREIRDRVLSDYGYDIYQSFDFSEFYVSVLLGGRRMRHDSHFDVEVSCRYRYEIKYSSVNVRSRRKLFSWDNLRGVSLSKDGFVDFIVLCGFYEGEWMFWVVKV